MAYITLKCKNCGSGMSINPDSNSATCTHCGSTFMMVDLLDEKDMSFSKSMSPKDLQQKIDFAEALKRGETCLYQAQYDLAEEFFKKAIELNEKNYKGYLGVVKAKTFNLNKIPETPEYSEYAKLALKYVDSDNEIYLKNELSKLELLEHEHNQKKQELEKKRSEAIKKERTRAINEKFWGKVTIAVIAVITSIILICIFLTRSDFPKQKTPAEATYEISTVQDLTTSMTNENFMSATIIIKNDLDFNNSSWTPIGTKNRPFTGKFYGNNHKISNLNIKSVASENTLLSGFFGSLSNAEIYGLSLDNSKIVDSNERPISTTFNIGFVSGIASNSIIKKCEISDTCQVVLNQKKQTLLSYGGLVGIATNCSISYSYSNSNVFSSFTNVISLHNTPLKFYVGGLIGESINTTLTNCYSSSKIETSTQSVDNDEIITYIGGIVAYNTLTNNATTKITNCFFTGKINNFVACVSSKYFIAGIVAYGAIFEQLQNNFSVFDTDTFKHNNNQLTTDKIYDQSSNKNSVKYIPSTEILEKIEECCSDSVWENTNTTKPTIK